ncbi:MAG: hypothetical protein WC700_14505 [Gemmatimonadaceae bacterium]|jgi:hypothetical protein
MGVHMDGTFEASDDGGQVELYQRQHGDLVAVALLYPEPHETQPQTLARAAQLARVLNGAREIVGKLS